MGSRKSYMRVWRDGKLSANVVALAFFLLVALAFAASVVVCTGNLAATCLLVVVASAVSFALGYSYLDWE